MLVKSGICVNRVYEACVFVKQNLGNPYFFLYYEVKLDILEIRNINTNLLSSYGILRNLLVCQYLADLKCKTVIIKPNIYNFYNFDNILIDIVYSNKNRHTKQRG